MIIIAWIVLILNALIVLITFPGVFTDKSTSGRLANFISCIGGILSLILSIYIIRL
ncbi:hypothetical protein [Clostridium sp.]|uniref:hypothetical protein n=1 Tax=Clostridium sp. TaxID=1506 RepID=UPI001ED54BFF|nr:hypothetical protein [Clostridium sp.]MBS5886687.1 hypothetical protein [Clostridium sp.]